MLGNNTNTSMRSEDFKGWVQGPDTRGTLDIIWSCVAVLVTALWTVLHLNIPGENDTLRHLLARKFRWGLVSVLAPDFLTLVAASQWDAAKKSVAKMSELRAVKEDKSKWCMEHAFYANSGGFLLKCSDMDAFPLDAHAVHYLVSREYIRLPSITRDEVWDRSKADLFAKAATIIQSAWLIIGSIGRAASGLPLSPMETFTLAFIVSTIMSYFFWWRKPQNVETPVTVFSEHTMADIRKDAGLSVDGWKKSPMEFIEMEHKRWKRRTIFDTYSSPSLKRLQDLEDKPGSLASTLSVASPISPTSTMMSPASTFASDKTLLPTVEEKKPPPRIYDDAILPCGLTPLVLLSVALPSMVHSAIHLLGWNFEYPTHAEKQLWRSAAVILNVMACITVGGVRALTILGYQGRFNLIYIWVNNPAPAADADEKNESASQTPETRWWKRLSFWDAFLTFGTFSLLLARFFIIAEVLISFRALPKDVFVTVNWTDYLPHI